MTNFIKKHWQGIGELVGGMSSEKIVEWFLTTGYYPESYVLPPCFHSKNFKLENKRHYTDKCTWSNPQRISFPKGTLSDRTFGIIQPFIYHDMIFVLKKHWSDVFNHLFSDLEKRKIFSYSFPVPPDPQSPGEISEKKSKRLIYEYIEMAERDLAADAVGYEYVLHADVKNCYPSIYSHSICWAFLGKEKARDIHQRYGKGIQKEAEKREKQIIKTDDDRDVLLYAFTDQLDNLMQCSNNGCTNGIPIGPATSDLMCEIILTAVDKELSQKIKEDNISAFGVRFKDDYRILCKNEKDTKRVAKHLQTALEDYNLFLNEEKTKSEKFPDGLYRPWSLEYQRISPFVKQKLDARENISFKSFESLYFSVLEIFEKHPGRGLERFLGDLIDIKTKKILVNFNLDFDGQDTAEGEKKRKRNVQRFLNLLWALTKKHRRILPQVLGIFEILLHEKEILVGKLRDLFKDFIDQDSLDEYALCWIQYFLMSNNLEAFSLKKNDGEFLKSIMQEKNLLFEEAIGLFSSSSEAKEKFGLICEVVSPFFKKTESGNS